VDYSGPSGPKCICNQSICTHDQFQYFALSAEPLRISYMMPRAGGGGLYCSIKYGKSSQHLRPLHAEMERIHDSASFQYLHSLHDASAEDRVYSVWSCPHKFCKKYKNRPAGGGK
jgi:hypothetical protein